MSFDTLFLYVSIFIPDAQTQILFKDSIENSFTLSFDSWSFDRKIVDIHLEYQADIGNAQNFNSPKYLLVSHQIAVTIVTPNKAINVAVFDNLNARKYHADIDGVHYPRDGVSIDFASNDYVDQYRDLNLFYKEYVEELLNPFKSYTDMKNKYPVQVNDLRFQVDLVNPKRSTFWRT